MNSGTVNTDIDPDMVLKEIVPLLLLIILWVLILLGFQIAGFVMLIVKRKNFKLAAREGEPGRKVILHKLTHSVEMWVFFAFALLLFVYSYLPDNLAVFFG